MSLKALALNATLKSSTSAEPSSTERVLALILQELGDHDVQSEMIWLADHDVKAGVTSDEGEGGCVAGYPREDSCCRYSFVWDTDMARTAFERVQASAGAHGCISGGNGRAGAYGFLRQGCRGGSRRE